ncbi:MAG TPA: hypothetical protein V6C71_11620 [Coleofasciculaceae cyanobacterium]|jgi:hypothetical protein
MMKQCVLIIDSSDEFINLIKSIFSSCANWQILTAFTKQEGITVAQLEQPGIIY